MKQAAPWTAGASIYPAVQNIILACRALGLGTVLTTNHTVAEEEVKAVLNLPAHITTFALMPIGFPAWTFGPLKRKPVSEAAVLDRYSSPFSANKAFISTRNQRLESAPVLCFNSTAE